MPHLQVRHLEFSVDGRSLSGLVRKRRVVLLVGRDNVPGWLRARAGRCIRRVLSRVDRAGLAVRDVLGSRRGRALVHGRAARVRFRLQVRLRPASGQVNGRVSVAAVSATRR
jgi:hypothetical protein